ncbi:MAG: GPP34 family phosphoprotein, partial [Raoultibacter sp.]
TVEKKKITVVNEMPQECGHLASLYTYLSKKPTDAKKVMSAFYAGPRINQLTTDVGESLLAEGLVTTGTNGVFGPKVTYITEKSYRDELIAIIKSALTDTDAITAQDVTLLYILQGTKNLNRYLSQHENNELKAKLKEMKKNPQNKELANLITHIEDLTNLFMIFILIAP